MSRGGPGEQNEVEIKKGGSEGEGVRVRNDDGADEDKDEDGGDDMIWWQWDGKLTGFTDLL